MRPLICTMVDKLTVVCKFKSDFCCIQFSNAKSWTHCTVRSANELFNRKKKRKRKGRRRIENEWVKASTINEYWQNRILEFSSQRCILIQQVFCIMSVQLCWQKTMGYLPYVWTANEAVNLHHCQQIDCGMPIKNWLLLNPMLRAGRIALLDQFEWLCK